MWPTNPRYFERARLAGLLLTAGVAGLLAQNPPASTAELQGTVVSCLGESGIAGARVIAEREGAKAVTVEADDHGGFQFQGLPPGLYALSARADGFVEGPFAGQVIGLSGGQNVQDYRLVLIPQGVISGSVVDEQGRAVERSGVRLLRRLVDHGKPILGILSSTSTDDRGTFRIWGIPPGRYWVLASVPSQRLSPVFNPAAGREVALMSTFYPSGLEFYEATPVVVDAGARCDGVDIRLRFAPVVGVRGKVTDAAGRGLGAARQARA